MQITIESILKEISDVAEKDTPMGAGWWLNKTQVLHTLARPYIKGLFIQQQKLALKQLALMDEAKAKGEKMSVAECLLRISTTDEWVNVETTKAMIKWIDSQTQIAKKRSELEREERNNQF